VGREWEKRIVIDDLAKEIHETAVEKGFWDSDLTPDVILAKMALIHSEISEILEAYRKEQGYYKITEEFADVFIRLADLWQAMSEHGMVSSLDEAIAIKMTINQGRERKHGNLI
jgi:NTP pyrophosphatase (non-canonical NTP hydrolase)